MQILVLGSAAGGGFPQWNCNCEMCAGVRKEEIRAQPRSQSSIAVSKNGVDWALINASPDIRQQLLANPPLQPARAKRDTGIRAVVLMDSQIDHTTGLLTLRENQDALQLYCTAMVHQDLTSGFPVINMLEHYCGVEWHEIDLDREEFSVRGVDGISFRAVPLSSKAPPYSPHRNDPHPGDNIGLLIEDTESGSKAFYAPGLAAVSEDLVPYMEAADCLLVDGTCWTNDEMKQRGVGTKLALDMGHLPQSGDDGMMAQLERFGRQRRILIHINNTNPILHEDSPERAQLDAAGIEVARDGMTLEL